MAKSPGSIEELNHSGPATFVRHVNQHVDWAGKTPGDLQGYFRPLSFHKKDFILSAGQICREDYFICKGCVRLFFLRENGTEQIIQFAIENWWVSDYMSLSTHAPAQFFIQALEDTEVLAVSEIEKENLVRDFPVLGRYFRLVMQRALAASQFRVKYLFDFSREELYHHFKSHFPDFVQRVPQYMLASYLGFTPEYLSELRKKG